MRAAAAQRRAQFGAEAEAPRTRRGAIETPCLLCACIAETDHLIPEAAALPNLATPTTPAGFNFGYMVAAGQANIVNKFVPGDGREDGPGGAVAGDHPRRPAQEGAR